jgi:hypothetical protein
LTGLLKTTERQREREGYERQEELQGETKHIERTKEMRDQEESQVKSTREKRVE